METLPKKRLVEMTVVCNWATMNSRGSGGGEGRETPPRPAPGGARGLRAHAAGGGVRSGKNPEGVGLPSGCWRVWGRGAGRKLASGSLPTALAPASASAMARKKRRKAGDGSQARLVLTFDEEKRRDYLTGFHKRKVERRKAALEEIRRKLQEERRKLRDERHKEYLKMLRDREEALEEADALEQLVTARTECVQYDHPNHTVTVTTISDLDLSGARQLGLAPPGGEGDPGAEGAATPLEGAVNALPKKSRNPLLSQRISALTASLHARSQKRAGRKRPRLRHSLDSAKKPPRATRTTKTHRRRMTGRTGKERDGGPG